MIALGTADQNIRLLKKKLTVLPGACPECGEKEGWVQIRVVNPYDSDHGSRGENILEGLFEAGPLGALVGALFPTHRKTVTYRCKKCDYRGEFKPR